MLRKQSITFTKEEAVLVQVLIASAVEKSLFVALAAFSGEFPKENPLQILKDFMERFSDLIHRNEWCPDPECEHRQPTEKKLEKPTT